MHRAALRDLRDRGISVALELAQGTHTATAVPGAVEQVLDNAIDNAMKVSAAGSTIEVVVGESTAGKAQVVRVVDHAVGLSDTEKTQAFQRFWPSSTWWPVTMIPRTMVGADVIDTMPGVTSPMPILIST
mgnify:CR=1 FL=1